MRARPVSSPIALDPKAGCNGAQPLAKNVRRITPYTSCIIYLGPVPAKLGLLVLGSVYGLDRTHLRLDEPSQARSGRTKPLGLKR